jgi:hypothetical protein
MARVAENAPKINFYEEFSYEKENSFFNFFNILHSFF